MVVVTNKTDADTDIVEVVTVDVAAGKLIFPTVTDFDLAVSGGCAVADDEVIGETILHFADAAVVIVESLGVSLPSAAVVNHDVLPAAFDD